MTGRPLDLTARQIRAIAKGARDAGCIAEVVIGKTVVRLIPEDRVVPEERKPEVDQYEGVVP